MASVDRMFPPGKTSATLLAAMIVYRKRCPGCAELDISLVAEELQAMSLRFPILTHRRLKLLNVETGKSMNEMINEAVEQWLPGAEADASADSPG